MSNLLEVLHVANREEPFVQMALRVGMFARRVVEERVGAISGPRPRRGEQPDGLSEETVVLAWARAAVATLDYYDAQLLGAFEDMASEPSFMQGPLYGQFWEDLECAYRAGAGTGAELREAIVSRRCAALRRQVH